MNEVAKACITGALIGASLFFIAKAANAEQTISGETACHVWTDDSYDQIGVLAETGYAVGFSDAFALTGKDTRQYRYGEVVAAITRECWKDKTQDIAVAAVKAMMTFVK
jgi:hypothetical protein